MITRNSFWRLDSPSDERKLAEWSSAVEQESVVCPAHPEHRRAGRRLGRLRVTVPQTNRDDVVWTWHGDCLISESVLTLLRREGITGYTVEEAEVRTKSLGDKWPAPHLWELSVTGWGGIAPPGSGITLDPRRSCEACQMLVYSGLTTPESLLNEQEWDGSDIFIIWPLPRYIFVSDRVARLLMAQEITGIQLTRLADLPQTSAILSPGRLSYWMPRDRARQLGAPFGIE